MNKQVNLYEAKTQLSRLVEEAARGKEIIIAKNGKPMARIVAMDTSRPKKRRLGLSKLGIREIGSREENDADIAQLFEDSVLAPFPD